MTVARYVLVHEAGHLVVGIAQGAIPVRASVVPEGERLGLVAVSPCLTVEQFAVYWVAGIVAEVELLGRDPIEAMDGGRSDLAKMEAEARASGDTARFARTAVDSARAIVREHRTTIEAVADLLEARPEFGSWELAAAVVAAWQAPTIRAGVERGFWESAAAVLRERQRARAFQEGIDGDGITRHPQRGGRSARATQCPQSPTAPVQKEGKGPLKSWAPNTSRG